MLKKQLLLFFALLLPAFTLPAQSSVIPNRPNPPRLVNNLSATAFLSSGEEAQLEQKLEKFANETSNQIVVVITDDIGEMEDWEYATELGSKWGVGQGKTDNGIVILIKPTGGQGKRKLFIAVGKGLEGAIPDLATKRIRENEMYPYLKKGQNFIALDKATDVLMALAKGEYNSDQYGARHKNKDGSVYPPIIVIVIIIIVVIALRRSGFRGHWLGGGFGGGGFGGGWGGGSSGDSGGGFGGFGGGSFGGGGSGGDW